jgi:hypothetical protein
MRLGPRPRHGHPRIFLARRTRHDQVGAAELRAMQRQNVLNHKLRRIAVIAIDVLLNVKTNDVIVFSEQSFAPSA